MRPDEKRDIRAQIARDLREARVLLGRSIEATIAETEEFPTSSLEYPDTMWDVLQWLSNRIAHADATTGEVVVDQVKAKEVAMILTGGDAAESDAFVAKLVTAVDQTNKMTSQAGYIPTPLPF